MRINGLKVFSATKFQERQSLGELITHWLQAHPDLVIVDFTVRQSSDRSFHCLSIILWFHDPNQ